MRSNILYFLIIIFCDNYKNTEGRILQLNTWGKYKRQYSNLCSDTNSVFAYNTLYIGRLKRSHCFSRCESMEDCSSVFYLMNTMQFGHCILANSVSGCASPGILFFKKIATGRCANGGIANEYGTCACANGYRGQFCELEIDECASTPCENGASCMDQINGFMCICPDGFAGLTCADDLCAAVSCLNYGTQVRVQGGCQCSCIQGFNGDFCQIDVGPIYDSANPLLADNGFEGGIWQTIDMCPTGYYAAGAQLWVDEGGVDDHGVDVVRLHCRHEISFQMGVTLDSEGLFWGEIQENVYCEENYFVVQFQLYNEPSGADSDISATNKMAIKCRGPGLSGTDIYSVEVPGLSDDNAQWGSWSQQCPSGQAINALQVKFEDAQGMFGDDTAVGDVKMFCSYY